MAATKGKAPKRRCALDGCSKPATLLGRAYWTEDGEEKAHHLGYFCSSKHRTTARELWRFQRSQDAEREAVPAADRITVAEYADEYLERMESGALLTKGGRRFKDSSIGTARGQLRRFKADFGDRTLGSIDRHEAVRWAEKHGRKQGALQSVNTLFALACDEEILSRNPFRGLMRKPEGRGAESPPTDAEFNRLLKACDVHDEYGPMLRAMLTFCAYTIVRPGEAMALDWSDINLPALRVTISKRLYRGQMDLPKSNRVRVIALTPPARDAVLSLPEREGPVFRSKAGGRLCAPLLSSYWREVQAAAGLRFDWYMATKHRGVHYMKVKLGLPNHVIAAQAGWSESAVEKMVATYAHAEIGALDAIDAAFATVDLNDREEIATS